MAAKDTLRAMQAILFIPFSLYRSTIDNWPNLVLARLGRSCAEGPTFIAQVAKTAKERQKGLSKRIAPLEDNESMLFVWDHPEPGFFWMKDTWIPLTVLFFNSDSTLLKVHKMPVEADPSHPTQIYPRSTEVSVAMEINQSERKLGFTQDSILCIGYPIDNAD
jgi:uncharacterized membrane protein (UPF0127 family)